MSLKRIFMGNLLTDLIIVAEVTSTCIETYLYLTFEYLTQL